MFCIVESHSWNHLATSVTVRTTAVPLSFCSLRTVLLLLQRSLISWYDYRLQQEVNSIQCLCFTLVCIVFPVIPEMHNCPLLSGVSISCSSTFIICFIIVCVSFFSSSSSISWCLPDATPPSSSGCFAASFFAHSTCPSLNVAYLRAFICICRCCGCAGLFCLFYNALPYQADAHRLQTATSCNNCSSYSVWTTLRLCRISIY